MGTLSEFALSNGNTYPAIAVPWGDELLDAANTKDRRWVAAMSNTDNKINGFKTDAPTPARG